MTTTTLLCEGDNVVVIVVVVVVSRARVRTREGKGVGGGASDCHDPPYQEIPGQGYR